MSEARIKSIRITKTMNLENSNEIYERLRNVGLRDFKDVKIYKNAKFSLAYLSTDEIKNKLHTPQLRVYKNPNLERIATLTKLFQEQNINILNLTAAYDYIATDSEGIETEWTMLPPTIERFSIPKTQDGKLDYASIMGPRLIRHLNEKGLDINPEIQQIPHTGNESGEFNLINDGSHRIYHGFENGGIRVLIVSGMTPGFPYYAAPQKYNVKVFDTREEALKLPETKVHIAQSPGHKGLYRVFPSGGIMSGNVRPH